LPWLVARALRQMWMLENPAIDLSDEEFGLNVRTLFIPIESLRTIMSFEIHFESVIKQF
jgi:hypothetical protein